MSDIAVEVDHVWKKFHKGEFHDSLRDFVPALAKRIMGRGPKRTELEEDDFWALKDVSFQVKQGEVLGIIGPNGAGKSTMLKVLSRILKPNRGRVQVNGRLRALIEIAAGFHPDLTGRENVYLNGTILGMKKREIDKKFDEIVDFSGIEEFLDTPVKRYSSGMYARLGFAVAAHLDPEILIVDEVLAVGDFQFQKKCLGKMQSVAGEGRTVLFVSHNMGAVQTLCSRGMLLDQGAATFVGPVDETVSEYLARWKVNSNLLADRREEDPSKTAWLTGVAFRSPDGEALERIHSGEPLDIHLSYKARRAGLRLDVGIGIYDPLGIKILHLGTQYAKIDNKTMPAAGAIVCHIPKLPLPEGEYRINLSLHCQGHRADHVVGAAVMNVVAGDFYGSGRSPQASETKFFLEHNWKYDTELSPE